MNTQRTLNRGDMVGGIRYGYVEDVPGLTMKTDDIFDGATAVVRRLYGQPEKHRNPNRVWVRLHGRRMRGGDQPAYWWMCPPCGAMSATHGKPGRERPYRLTRAGAIASARFHVDNECPAFAAASSLRSAARELLRSVATAPLDPTEYPHYLEAHPEVTQ